MFGYSIFYPEFSLNTRVPIIGFEAEERKLTKVFLIFLFEVFYFLFFFSVYQIGRKLAESKVYAAVHTAESHF